LPIPPKAKNAIPMMAMMPSATTIFFIVEPPSNVESEIGFRD
jgi:hypothetical protein